MSSNSRLGQYLIGLAVLLWGWAAPAAAADEPISPIPKTIAYDPGLADLGKQLFFDRRLSRDGGRSCADCHGPTNGSADNCEDPAASDTPPRNCNPPTVFNAVFNFRQYWDGRAADLRAQAAEAIGNPAELAADPAVVMARLAADPDYPGRFATLFGDPDIRLERVAIAIAEFERALITPDSRFDRYLRREAELAPAERDGYLLFKTLGCMACHNGVNIGGNSFQYLPREMIDGEGGQGLAATDPGLRVKVPTLRNIAITAPYLRDGSDRTLEEALQTMAFHYIGTVLEQQEWSDLATFLQTLTGEPPAILRAP